MSTKCRNASQNLSFDEVKGYARTVAVMAYTYEPEVYSRIISSDDIARALGNLLNGHLSIFHVENDTLKMAFAYKTIREALKQEFPGGYEFLRASAVTDVIVTTCLFNGI